MADQGNDFDSLTKWCDDTFDRLTELFRHRVAAYVATRFLTIGTGVITVVGILSFFGIRQSYQSVAENATAEIAEITENAKVQMSQVADMVENAVRQQVTEQVAALLVQIQEATFDARAEIRVSQVLSAQNQDLVSDTRMNVRELVDELTPLRKSLEGFQATFDTLKAEIGTAEDALERGGELSLVLMLPVVVADGSGDKDILGRIQLARERLTQDPEDEHERLVLVRYVQEVGTREFKGDSAEADHKRRTVSSLMETLSRRPAEGLITLDHPRFRQIRVQTIYALRSLASNDPVRDDAIAALTSILENGQQYLEADGTAWALGCLTDDGYLRQLSESGAADTFSPSQRTFRNAVAALARAAGQRSDTELRRVATSTLRELSSIKQRWMTPLFQSGLLTIDDFASVDGALARALDARRQRAFRTTKDWAAAMRSVDDYLAIRPYDLWQVANKIELLLILGEYGEAHILTKDLRDKGWVGNSALYDFFDAVRTLMAESEDYEHAKAALIRSADEEPVALWSFTTFQGFVETDRPEIKDEVDTLVSIASGNVSGELEN